jgi:hypothetical protein
LIIPAWPRDRRVKRARATHGQFYEIRRNYQSCDAEELIDRLPTGA